jgi:seryl-tRNA(Sec) selenium transferase
LTTLESLGVDKVINAAGPETVLGGSSLASEVVEAMSKVSTVFLDMNELLQKASDRIAEIMNVEAALITSGAAT